jgi:hypothetical protein
MSSMSCRDNPTMAEAVEARPTSGVTAVPAARVRRAASIALLLAASVAVLAGGLALYARQEIVNSSAFADRAVDAVHQPAVQRVIARELAVQVIEPSAPDVIAARPVLVAALRSLVGSSLFTPVVRLAAEQGHHLLFERHAGNALFDVADAGKVISSALQALAPKVAARIPANAEAVLLTLRRRSFADQTLRFADAVRVLGLVLPVLALALFALAVVVDPRRRRALTTGALAIAVTGIAFAIAFELFRRYVIDHVYGTQELTTADVRGAVGALWGAYLGDVLTWALGVALVALLVAAAAAPILRPYSARERLGRLRSYALRPSSPRVRAVRGGLVLALGVLLIVDPSFMLRVVAVLGGCVLAYFGAGEVLTATVPDPPRVWRPRAPARRQAVAIGTMAAALAAAILIAVAFTGGTRSVRAATVMACNGYPQLCDLPLDQVVFAGTHNSMSAADTSGWLIPNQDRSVAQQLDDGIRLFKISTHYGTADSSGFVHTDIAAEGQLLNRVSAKLDPAARAALQRLSRSLTPGSLAGRRREIWLCHTLCELGATRMLGFLTTIRQFLQLNPNQVIILFDEDYVAERDLRSVFESSGLFPYLATLRSGQPLPTLAQLIRSRHNVVVFAQKPPSGHYPWNANAFQWIQDTPLGAQRPSQFTCNLSRGSPNNPLLMMNDWADVFPPRLSPNLPLVKRAFILSRARQCVQQRGRGPDLILTDFYDRGDVIGAVAALNGVANERPAAVRPVQ